MKLIITNERHECTLDEQHFTVDEFNDIMYHPYIQSVRWDVVYLDLDDKLNRGLVKQVLGRKPKIVPRLTKNVITPQNVLTLIEICPDYAGKLMRAQSEGQESLQSLFKELSKMYFWD